MANALNESLKELDMTLNEALNLTLSEALKEVLNGALNKER